MHTQPGQDEQDEQLIDLMLEEIAAAPDADERAGLLVDLADLLEKGGDTDRAVRCLEAARDESPDRPGLFDRLTAGLERCGRFADLADLLADRLECTQGDDRAALARRLAELCEGRLADPARAQIAWRAVLTERPSDREALSALARLYAAAGQLRERLAVLRQLSQATESNSERAALHRELAEGYADLGELEAAAEQLEWSLASEEGTADDLRNLARMYLALGRVRAAIDAHVRRAAMETGRERARVQLEIAALFEGVLHDLGRAIDFCQDAEAAAPQDDAGLRALIRLYEKREDHDAAIAALERLAARAAAPAERAETLTRAGRRAERSGDDDDEAIRLYEAALHADPSCAVALRRLAALHRVRGEAAEAARLIVHALGHCEDPALRAELAHQAGELHEELGDRGGAMAFYRDALDSDADLVPAASRLAELLWQEELHGEVVGVLEDLCRMDPLADRPVALERATRLAHAYGVLGLDRRALVAVRRAVAAATEGRTLRALQRREGDLCSRLGLWHDASAAFERVLAAAAELPLELPLADRVELFHSAGVAAARTGQPALASRRLGEALALEPQHRASLMALLDLVRGEPRTKLDILRALARQVDGAERAELLVEIGDILTEELRQPADALAAYRDALALSPGDHLLIHKCMGQLMEEQQWVECRAMFDKLIATEADAVVRAKYTHAAALLCLEELDQRDEAIRLLWTALDDDPGLTAAQVALEDILRAGAQWQALGNLYCKLLAHVGKEGAVSEDDARRQLRLRLWSDLGELCWTRLDQRDSAIDALDVASRLAPDDTDRLRALADRAAQAGPAHRARAIAAHQRLLALNKLRAASYEALAALYEQDGLERHARACAHAHAFTLPVGSASDSSTSGLRPRPRAGGIDVADRVVTGEMWAELRHPDEDPVVDAVLTLIAPVAAASAATTIKRLALELGGADPLPSDSMAGRVMARVAGVLGVPRPLALACPESRVGLDVRVIADRGAVRLVLVFGAPLLQGAKERPLAFHIGRALASLRGGGIIRWLLPRHDQIALLLEAVAQLGRGTAAEPAAVASTVRSLERSLGARELEQLTVLGKRLQGRALLSEAAAREWLRAHDLSIARVGLVACGDLATALDVLAADAPSGGRHPSGMRAQELIWSSASQPVLEVRAHLEDWYAPEEEIAIMSRDIIVSSAR